MCVLNGIRICERGGIFFPPLFFQTGKRSEIDFQIDHAGVIFVMILEFAFVADGKFGGIAERNRQSRAGFDAEAFHRVARRDIAGMIGQDDRAEDAPRRALLVGAQLRPLPQRRRADHRPGRANRRRRVLHSDDRLRRLRGVADRLLGFQRYPHEIVGVEVATELPEDMSVSFKQKYRSGSAQDGGLWGNDRWETRQDGNGRWSDRQGSGDRRDQGSSGIGSSVACGRTARNAGGLMGTNATTRASAERETTPSTPPLTFLFCYCFQHFDWSIPFVI